MKTIKLIAVIMISAITSMSFAAGKSNPDKVTTKSSYTVNDIKDIISSQVSFPNTILSDYYEGEVVVTFTFNDNNQLVIKDMVSSDQRLKKHIEQELNKIEIENASQIVDEPLMIRFVFRKNNQRK